MHSRLNARPKSQQKLLRPCLKSSFQSSISTAQKQEIRDTLNNPINNSSHKVEQSGSFFKKLYKSRSRK